MELKKEIEQFNGESYINYFLGKALVKLAKEDFQSCVKSIKRYASMVNDADSLYGRESIEFFIQEKLATKFPEHLRESVYGIISLSNLSDYGTETLNYAIFDFYLPDFNLQVEKVCTQILGLERHNNAN